MKSTFFTLLLGLILSAAVLAQIPERIHLGILKAEDARRADTQLVSLLVHEKPDVRMRAALALGRIGDDSAVPALEKLLDDPSVEVMAAFALGEIESPKAVKAIVAVMKDQKRTSALRAAAVEAAGKIAAANTSDSSSKQLGEAILDVLESESIKHGDQSKAVVLAGLTAALRARAQDTDYIVAKFFTNKDARVRADAANAYARVRGTSSNKQLQSMLLIDEDPVARANAARALGAAGDKTALNLLLDAADTDEDLRVRVNAMRSVGQIDEPATAERVKKRVEAVFAAYKASKEKRPSEQNELLEGVSALGNVASGSGNETILDLLKNITKATDFRAVEAETAIAKVDPRGYWAYLSERPIETRSRWYQSAAAAQAFSSIIDEIKKEENADISRSIADHLKQGYDKLKQVTDDDPEYLKAVPSIVSFQAELAPVGIDETLRAYLEHPDLMIRAAAASAIGKRPVTEEDLDALSEAFRKSLLVDKDYNDAQMAILSALVSRTKERSKPSLALALNHYDYLVRRQAFQLIKANDLEKEFPDAESLVKGVRKYDPKHGSKLGQVLNEDEDYRRALSRKNGTVFAVVSTAKGKFEIEFFPEAAPLTVDNFVKLAEKGYFNGIDIHRVVANFVVQDGDPRGDGNGGPGWSIRCEINRIPYERGMVGMALSGKDTGGSQWFVTHSPQPHLDGGYTVFGKVDEDGMKVVDRLVRGDTIDKIEIVVRK